MFGGSTFGGSSVHFHDSPPQDDQTHQYHFLQDLYELVMQQLEYSHVHHLRFLGLSMDIMILLFLFLPLLHL